MHKNRKRGGSAWWVVGALEFGSPAEMGQISLSYGGCRPAWRYLGCSLYLADCVVHPLVFAGSSLGIISRVLINFLCMWVSWGSAETQSLFQWVWAGRHQLSGGADTEWQSQKRDELFSMSGTPGRPHPQSFLLSGGTEELAFLTCSQWADAADPGTNHPWRNH